MDVNVLRQLSRKDIQKLAQREKIKANSKTETMITELVAKYPDGVPRLMAKAPKKSAKSEPAEENVSVAEEPEKIENRDKADRDEAVTQDAANLIKNNNIENNEAGESTSKVAGADSATASAEPADAITEPVIPSDGGEDASVEATSSGDDKGVTKSTVPGRDAVTASAEQQVSPPESSEPVLKGVAPENKAAPLPNAAATSDRVQETPAQVAARHAATGKRFIPISPLALTSVVAGAAVVPDVAPEEQDSSSPKNAAGSDLAEDTAAQIATRRVDKGKGRALPTSPLAASHAVPTAAQFMPQINPDWWKKAKTTEAQAEPAEVEKAPENKAVPSPKAAAISGTARETPAQVAARHAATGKRFIPISPLALNSVVAGATIVPDAPGNQNTTSKNAVGGDPAEGTAAEIAARRATKGKGRALPSSPLAASHAVPTAAQFMPQISPDWWKKTKKPAEAEPAANAASDGTAPSLQSPTQIVDPGYLIDQYLQDVAHMGSKGLVKKALRMARGQPTPIKNIMSAAYKDAARRSPTTGPSSPTPRSKSKSKIVAAVAAALAAAENVDQDTGLPSGTTDKSNGSLNSARSTGSSLDAHASSNGTDRDIESVSPAPGKIPIRGATEKRADQILRRIEAMVDEAADVRRSIQDLKVVTDIAKQKTKKSMIAIERMRALRVVITKHYVNKLRDDERLYNGSQSWVQPKEGEPERDYSYKKDVSDEASSSLIVPSSDSAGGASGPVAEGSSGKSGQADQSSPEAGSSKLVGEDGGDTEPEDEGDAIPQNDGGDTEPEDEGGDTEPEED